MLHGALDFPPYSSVKHLEGAGNYAIARYYKWPYRFFYRHKVAMITSLMDKCPYHNILEYGAGAGILATEFKKHALFYTVYDKGYLFDYRWRFELVVCPSVLEFVDLPSSLESIKRVIRPGGRLIVASPMDTWITRRYFKIIKDGSKRNSHQTIIDAIQKTFEIEKLNTWFGLYFALRARPK